MTDLTFQATLVAALGPSWRRGADRARSGGSLLGAL